MKFKKPSINFAAIILIAVILSSAHKERKDKAENISLTVSVKKRETINGVTFLFIKASLTNVSTDTLKYIMMSCYYPFYYRVNPISYFVGEESDCDKNVPELITIAPKKNIDTFFKLQLDKNVKQETDASFKIGVRLITVSNTLNLQNDNRNFLGFYPNAVFFDFLNDTSYQENVKLITIKNTGYDKVDTTNTIATVKILWSKEIKL